METSNDTDFTTATTFSLEEADITPTFQWIEDAIEEIRHCLLLAYNRKLHTSAYISFKHPQCVDYNIIQEIS